MCRRWLCILWCVLSDVLCIKLKLVSCFTCEILLCSWFRQTTLTNVVSLLYYSHAVRWCFTTATHSTTTTTTNTTFAMFNTTATAVATATATGTTTTTLTTMWCVGLIQLRNEMVHYIQHSSEKSLDFVDVEDSHWSFGRLPQPINNERTCATCPQLLACCAYQKYNLLEFCTFSKSIDGQFLVFFLNWFIWLTISLGDWSFS